MNEITLVDVFVCSFAVTVLGTIVWGYVEWLKDKGWAKERALMAEVVRLKAEQEAREAGRQELKSLHEAALENQEESTKCKEGAKELQKLTEGVEKVNNWIHGSPLGSGTVAGTGGGEYAYHFASKEEVDVLNARVSLLEEYWKSIRDASNPEAETNPPEVVQGVEEEKEEEEDASVEDFWVVMSKGDDVHIPDVFYDDEDEAWLTSPWLVANTHDDMEEALKMAKGLAKPGKRYKSVQVARILVYDLPEGDKGEASLPEPADPAKEPEVKHEERWVVRKKSLDKTRGYKDAFLTKIHGNKMWTWNADLAGVFMSEGEARSSIIDLPALGPLEMYEESEPYCLSTTKPWVVALRNLTDGKRVYYTGADSNKFFMWGGALPNDPAVRRFPSREAAEEEIRGARPGWSDKYWKGPLVVPCPS